ncbi:MAG TPA: response regulator transcription factor [Thermoanaerobaculia bacterium]
MKSRRGGPNLRQGREAYERRDFSRAFELLSEADREEPLGGDDLERLALAAALLGHDEEGSRLLERAHQAHFDAGKPIAAARCAVWLGFRLMGFGERARGSGWIARAARLLEPVAQETVERGYLLIAAARQKLEARELEAARAIAQEAAGIGERFAEADLVALARMVQGFVGLRGERVDEGLSIFDEAMVAVATDQLSPMVTGIIYCNVIQACQEVYAVGRAREWTNALKRWCDEQAGSFTFTGPCLIHRSEVLQLNGEWPDAIDEARRASERLLASADQKQAAPAFYQQAEIHRLRGEIEEAEQAYGAASRWGWEPQPGLALLRLAQGRVEAAAAAMRRAVAAATDRMRRTRLLPAHVEVMIAAGDLDEARRAAAELEDAARSLDIEVLAAMAAHARGSLLLAEGDPRGALEPLRRSFETWQRLGAPYLAARVRVEAARACRQLGDVDGCRMETDGAREIFSALGAAPDLAALDQAKAMAAASAKDRPHGLTPRELQVLRLVAQGKTNRAIGETLFLSEKTIDRHLSNIFDKLDVSSRAAATAFAYEHSLI